MIRKRRGRGEGAVFQRGDGRWTASLSLGYDSRGKRKRRVVYGKSKQGVQEKLRSLYNQADTPRELEQLTIEGYLQKWLSWSSRPLNTVHLSPTNTTWKIISCLT